VNGLPRNADPRSGTTWRLRVSSEYPEMNSTRKPQAGSSAQFFRREEGLEDPRLGLAVHPRSGVADGQLNARAGSYLTGTQSSLERARDRGA
jgi:hypothetical protein